MILALLAAAILAQPTQTITMVAPYDAKGSWNLVTSEYWQTWNGKAMNQPVQEIAEGEVTKATKDAHTRYRSRPVRPITGTPVIDGQTLRWARFEGVDGLTIRNSTIRFNRTENQGSGINLSFCRNVRIENTTFILESDVDPAIGGSGYGIAVTGSSDVTLVNCRFIKCHMGAMFTGNSKRFAVYDSVFVDTWALDLCHGWSSSGLAVRCKSEGIYGNLMVGNVTLPDGGSGFSVIDCNFQSLEFSGKISAAKVQGGSFRQITFNQYKARPGDAQSDYSQAGIEIDGSVKFGTVVVKQL